jgi:transcriptional regulator with XRE-family HTH domain
MSLETLAGLSGISKGHLSMVENGHRQMDRRSHLEAVANALQVSITDLTGQPYPPSNPTHLQALAAIPAIRAAIIGTAFDEPPDRTARPLPEILAAVERAEAARTAAEHASYAPLLPDLIEELHVHAATPDNGSRAALVALIGVYRSAIVLCKDLGYVDLTWIAADRIRQAAERLDDLAWLLFAELERAGALRSIGARPSALRVAERAAEFPSTRVNERRVMPLYGALYLSAGLSAVTGRSPSDVDAYLDEAANIARRTGEDDAFSLNFGPANVAAWRLSVAIERGDGGKAPEIVRGVDPAVFPSQRRRAYFYVDVGRAMAQTRGKDANALRMLRQAERLAPEMVRTHPIVRETVTTMIQRTRNAAEGRDLRGLAFRMGVTP